MSSSVSGQGQAKEKQTAESGRASGFHMDGAQNGKTEVERLGSEWGSDDDMAPLPDLSRLGCRRAGATGVRAREHNTAHAALAKGSGNASVREGEKGQVAGESYGMEPVASIAARSGQLCAASAEAKGTQPAEKRDGKKEARQQGGGCSGIIGGEGNGGSSKGMMEFGKTFQHSIVKGGNKAPAQPQQRLADRSSNVKSGVNDLKLACGSNPPRRKDLNGSNALLSARGNNVIIGNGNLPQSLPPTSLSCSSNSTSPPLPSHGHNSKNKLAARLNKVETDVLLQMVRDDPLFADWCLVALQAATATMGDESFLSGSACASQGEKEVLSHNAEKALWWEKVPASGGAALVAAMPESSLVAALTQQDVADLSSWLRAPAFAQYCGDVEELLAARLDA